MTWIALILALAGAYLVTLENRKWHLIGFCLWTCSNTYWAIHNLYSGEIALCIQFSIFLGLAALGIKNNRKYWR